MIVGVAGLFTSKLLGANTTVVHNLIHLVIGVWGVWAGFSKELVTA